MQSYFTSGINNHQKLHFKLSEYRTPYFQMNDMSLWNLSFTKKYFSDAL